MTPWRQRALAIVGDIEQRLAEIAPSSIVTSRVRADPVPIHDSIGLRLTTRDAAARDLAVTSICAWLHPREVRDYRSGRRQTPFYRAVHLLCTYEDLPLEVQVRTRRHDRLAEWAHDRLFVTPTRWSDVAPTRAIIDWLVAVADWYDDLDHGCQSPSPAPIPPELEGHLPQLGLAHLAGRDVPSAAPLLSHSTSSIAGLNGILRSGQILPGDKVPEEIPRFGPWTDRWTGRDQFVMFTPGYGRVVDRHATAATFVFNESISLRPGELHRDAEMWSIARLIVDSVISDNPEWLAKLVHDGVEDLAGYDHVHLGVAFADYLDECLRTGQGVEGWRDVWGPSAYARGLVEVVLERAPNRAAIEQTIRSWRSGNRVPGGPEALAFLRRNWRTTSVYRTPFDPHLSPSKHTSTQLAVRGPIDMGSSSLIAIVVPSSSVDALKEGLRRPDCSLDLTVTMYCGNEVGTLETLCGPMERQTHLATRGVGDRVHAGESGGP